MGARSTLTCVELGFPFAIAPSLRRACGCMLV
jgi:hypothetical protein